MYTVQGCLGTTVGSANTIPDTIALVRTQIPIGDKKAKTLANSLASLAVGSWRHVEYGTSGVSIQRT